MGFPLPPDEPAGTRPRSRNPAPLVASYLEQRFGPGQTLIVDLGESPYPHGPLEKAGPVVSFSFPGHPAPPLASMVRIAQTAEAWLAADPKHAVAVHCMSGKGRTAAALACISVWCARRPGGGLPGASLPQPGPRSISAPRAVVDALPALDAVCERRGSDVASLTLPSHVRSCRDFGSLLDGVAPHTRPVVIERVMVAGGLPSPGGEPLRPTLEVFKLGRLLWSSARHRPLTADDAALAASDPAEPFPPPLAGGAAAGVEVSEEEARVSVGLPVRGDILLRLRHTPARRGARPVTVFRAPLQTGFASGAVLRLGKRHLDVASESPDWSPDSYVELTIGAPPPAVASAAFACLADGSAAGEASAGAGSCSEGLAWALSGEADAFWEPALERRRPEAGADGDDAGAAEEAPVPLAATERKGASNFAVDEEEEEEEVAAAVPGRAAEPAQTLVTAEASTPASGHAASDVPGSLPAEEEPERAAAAVASDTTAADGAAAPKPPAGQAGAEAAVDDGVGPGGDEGLDAELADIEALEAELAASGSPNEDASLHASAVSNADTDLSEFESFLDEV